MRGVVLIVLVACSAPAPLAPASKVGAIDAWVIGPTGPIANAEVRVVSLAKQACACPAKPDDGTFDNAVPECSCPASYATWRERAAHCTWPAPAARVVRSDASGHVPLEARELG